MRRLTSTARNHGTGLLACLGYLEHAQAKDFQCRTSQYGYSPPSKRLNQPRIEKLF